MALAGRAKNTSLTLSRVQAVPGDVFYFPKGSVITFTTNSYGLAFYTGQRKKDDA
jgi:ethanolamine utilization protein EutQ (cupin superfamily)